MKQLVRHFAAALIDNDLLGAGEDLHTVLAGGLASFLVLSAAVALATMAKYNSVIETVGGHVRLAPARSLADKTAMALDDKMLLITAAMLLMGLLSVAFWDELVIDQRDRAFFGPLPVPPITVFLSKGLAIGGAAVVTATALNVLPAFFLPIVVLAETRSSLFEVVRWMAAQFLAGMAGCTFAFLACASCRLALGITLPRKYVRVGLSTAQFVLLLVLVSLLLLTPTLSTRTRPTVEGASHALLLSPFAWFLGLEEVLTGRSEGVLGVLGDTASVAWTAAICVTVFLYWLSFRFPRAAFARESWRPLGHAFSRLIRGLALTFIRGDTARAAFVFAGQALRRSRRHKLYLTASLGVGAAAAGATLSAAGSGHWSLHEPLAARPLALAAQLQIVFFVVAGARLASTLPADLRAGWFFRFYGVPTSREYVRGTRRAILLLVVVPVLVSLVPLHALLWGWHAAVLHATFGTAAAGVLLIILFARQNRVPFVAPFSPPPTLVTLRPVLYVIGYILFVYGLPDAESFLIDRSPLSWVWLVLFTLFCVAFALAPPAIVSQTEATSRPLETMELPVVRPDLFSGSYPDRALFRPFDGIGGDIRFAWRRLSATPRFLVFAVMSLAVGIALTTTVYSLVVSLMWAPLGFRDASKVVVLTSGGWTGQSGPRATLSPTDFEELAAAQTTLGSIAAVVPIYQTINTAAVSKGIDAEAVSADYFRLVGLKAALGRTLQQADQTGPAVVVLSDLVWRRRFGADRAVIGQMLRIGGHPFEIVGVMPAEFLGINKAPRRTMVWFPWRFMELFSASTGVLGDDRRELMVIGRLRPGVRVQSAAADVATIAARLDHASPIMRRAADGSAIELSRRWSVRGLAESAPSDWRVVILILAMAGLVLVVASTNLANLVLARGTGRQQEFAVRKALGASRWRVIRELLAETAVIATLGSVAGYAIAALMVKFSTVDLPLPRGTFSIEPRVSLWALLVAAASMVTAVVVFGLEPALELTRPGGTERFGTGGSTTGARSSRRQRALIRWQVAICTTFFLLTTILARIALVEARHDSGIDLDRLAIAIVPFPQREWDRGRSRAALTKTAELVRAQPGIESVSITSGMPFGLAATPHATIRMPGQPLNIRGGHESEMLLSATPNVFQTLGIALLSGRPFDIRDDAGAPHVAIVSERAAHDVLGTSNVIGRELVVRPWGRPPDLTVTIIGVARDTDVDVLMSRRNGVVWVPFAQYYEPHLGVVIARTGGAPATAALLIQEALRHADPDAGIGVVGPAPTLLSGSYFAARLGAAAAGILGFVTLALTLIGLYGLQSQVVALRRRELGLRMALGATARDIRHMVLRDGCSPVVQGLAAGLFFGVLARVAVRAVLVTDISTVDPVAYTLVSTLVVLAALSACVIPAERAARVNPNVTLRDL